MANRRSTSRFDRSTFQGLSVVEGSHKVSSASNHSSNNGFKLNQDRSERRRRTSSLAQSHQIRDIIARTVEELSLKGSQNNHGHVCLLPEEILNKVLGTAKESGYSADRIFSILSSSSIREMDEVHVEKIQKVTFVTGLRKLSKGIHTWNQQDLDAIADKFDMNGDGFISLAEFQHYCYHEVPSVAWKAERQRKETTQTTAAIEDNDTSFNIKDIKYSPGPECHRSTKLFWKINLSVEIVLRYCSELGIISIQIYNIVAKQDFQTLYVNKSSCAIDQDALNEAIAVASQTKDDKSPEEIEWVFYSNYLVARVEMAKDENDTTGYRPVLLKFHGDGDQNLAIDRPENMNAPARKYRPSENDGSEGNSLEDRFQRKVQSFVKETRSARRSRQTAEGFIRSARNSRNTAEGGLEDIMRQALEEVKLEVGES